VSFLPRQAFSDVTTATIIIVRTIVPTTNHCAVFYRMILRISSEKLGKLNLLHDPHTDAG